MSHDFRNRIGFLEGFQASSFHVGICRWVLGIGDNTLAGKCISTQRKTCPRATVFSTNPTYSGLGSNPGFSGDRPVNDRLSLKSGVYYISELSPYRAVNTHHLGYTNQSVNVV